MDSANSGMMSLLDPLYDAATHPEMWKVFLEKASAVLRADTAGIITHSAWNAQTSVCADIGFTEEMRRDLTQVTDFSPWIEEILKHQDRGGYSGSPEDVLPLEQFRNSKLYTDFFREHKIGWAGAAIVFNPDGFMPSFVVSRDETGSAFDESDKEVLRQLIPHLGRAFKVHGTVSALRDKSAAGQHALDLIGAACVTLDGGGRVLSMNRRAELLIAQGDTLRMKEHRLQAAVNSEQNVLDACLFPACACGAGRSTNPGAGALVLHSGHGIPLYLSVLPYRSSWSLLESSPAALVFITTHDERGSGEHRLWHSMFELSPAECRVAEMMKQGMEVAEISETIRIKVDTVRYYQKCVYRKTGVRGQGQLMRLLTRLPSSTT